MKECRFSILYNEGSVVLDFKDHDSGVSLIRVSVDSDTFLNAAMGRLSGSVGEYTHGNLSLIGKKKEVKKMSFPIPWTFLGRRDHMDEIHKLAIVACEDGWKPENYYNSQDSFFSEGEQNFARCTIKRWI